ncbi:hypothetical protein EMCRGX_G012236 [Ephydatia muelleri]
MAAGGDRKKVKDYYNCVAEGIFDIPLSQVCLPGLHITQGIFTKIYELLEDACHSLDLQLALVNHEGSSSASFAHYSNELKKLQSAQAKQKQAQSALSAAEELVTYVAIAFGEENTILNNLLQHMEEMRHSL